MGRIQPLTAVEFVSELRRNQSDAERDRIARYYRCGPDTEIIGVRMKVTFDLAKRFTPMPLDEVDRLLGHPAYEARMGAVSILDFKTRTRNLSDNERRSYFELYLRRHDRLDNWDLVDRAAPRVVGWYLLDKPRDVLYDLAHSENIWERRSAITATFWLIRQGDIEDALAIAQTLLADPEELVTKSVGVALREVGEIDRQRLIDFLEQNAGVTPRVTLRMAIEKQNPSERDRLRRLGS